jgi:hypothetical protein
VGSHRGRASTPSVPSEWDRAPPSKPMQALSWTRLRTAQPTLIERGMGVHLNHPLTARRGIRNPRPDRWGLWKPHPPSRGGTARARLKRRRAHLDRLERAQTRGLDARLHLLGCTGRRQCQLRVRHQSRLKHRRRRLEYAPRPLTISKVRTPIGAFTLLQGFGG